MRKQEFVHYHGLLAETAKYCMENGLDVDLEAYRALETRPTSIQLSKTDHTEAVFVLAEAVTAAIPDEEAEPVAVAAD